MRIELKYMTTVLVSGAAVIAVAAAPTAAADRQSPTNPQNCVALPASTKCAKTGDAEVNSSIPAPYPGVFGIYGPFWAG